MTQKWRMLNTQEHTFMPSFKTSKHLPILSLFHAKRRYSEWSDNCQQFNIKNIIHNNDGQSSSLKSDLLLLCQFSLPGFFQFGTSCLCLYTYHTSAPCLANLHTKLARSLPVPRTHTRTYTCMHTCTHLIHIHTHMYDNVRTMTKYCTYIFSRSQMYQACSKSYLIKSVVEVCLYCLN